MFILAKPSLTIFLLSVNNVFIEAMDSFRFYGVLKSIHFLLLKHFVFVNDMLSASLSLSNLP